MISARKKPVLLRLGAAAFSLWALLDLCAWAQVAANEREFTQSKAVVEKALQQMGASMSGRLPDLEGFSAAGDHPLNAYRRGFYQATAQVSSTRSGGTLVRITVKITAWFTDPVLASRSGYQLLNSNGRLEGDLLDQLGDQFSTAAPTNVAAPEKAPATAANRTPENPVAKNSSVTAAPIATPSLSAPMPRIPDSGGTFSSSLSQNLSAGSRASTPTASVIDSDNQLQAEASSLEEVLKNQAHPKNLVAVKKSGTPVVGTPSLTAKPLFFASAHDEFEMLNFNRDWVHVRISGLSRGWIWRNSLEMPDSVPDADVPTGPAPSPAAELFHVGRQETAVFPGDWQPLNGKAVKIVSVEEGSEAPKDDTSQLKLEFAKSVLDQNYNEVAQKTSGLSGIVVIFDSADGGMIAVTLASLQQWKAGHLSDAALWHQCFFDPPETFVPTGSTASR